MNNTTWYYRKKIAEICSHSSDDQSKHFKECTEKFEIIIGNIGSCAVRSKYYRYTTGRLESFEADLSNVKQEAEQVFNQIKIDTNLSEEMKKCCVKLTLLVNAVFECELGIGPRY